MLRFTITAKQKEKVEEKMMLCYNEEQVKLPGSRRRPELQRI